MSKKSKEKDIKNSHSEEECNCEESCHSEECHSECDCCQNDTSKDEKIKAIIIVKN